MELELERPRALPGHGHELILEIGRLGKTTAPRAITLVYMEK